MFSSYYLFIFIALHTAHSKNVTNRCHSVLDLGGECDIHVPDAQGWSGGWCLASISEAGWIRSTVINPVMAVVLSSTVEGGSFPIITGSNSGGSMFAMRYFVLRDYPTLSKWAYPCYLLSNPFRTTCYFHSGFGGISDECYAAAFDVVSMATHIVYGGVFARYGGPLGVASSYAFVCFPFLGNLPVRITKSWSDIVKRYVLMNTHYNVPSNWMAAHTLVSPRDATGGKSPYDYSFTSYLSRAIGSWKYSNNATKITGLNVSAAWVVSASANTQSGFVLMPFSISSKNRYSVTADNSHLTMISLIISFVMVRKVMKEHQVLNTAVFTEVKNCDGGCPILDGGFSDNAPLTPVVAASMKLPTQTRPSWILSVGAASTMSTIKYLMGTAPMAIWTFGGINVCPFTIGGLCTMITKLRTLMVGVISFKSQQSYFSISNAYGVYRPDMQLMVPYCGDPLAFDLFEGMCNADSVCDMWATILPNTLNAIFFSPDVYVIVFVMAFLQVTPVSSRFVKLYMPQQMWNIQYYSHMDLWFPNFDAVQPGKGGMGFTNIAGNSFLDYMTYLNLRLVQYIFETKQQAIRYSRTGFLLCDHKLYEAVETKTFTQGQFLGKQTHSRPKIK